ncbi:MAG: hypothetical protein AAB328_09645, partial [candidate division NC10 bacterium]
GAGLEAGDGGGRASLSGAHTRLCERVGRGLRAAGAGGIKVAVGGTIPQADVATLQAAGAWAVFPTGTPLPAIVEAFQRLGLAADPAAAR